ncbi:MAG: thermonuclease family protein [Erysipelothrix sp.]|nr:thermonuclease family protein [Erysipelothrix sp.]
MKYSLIVILAFILVLTGCQTNTGIETDTRRDLVRITLSQCIDGDTARFDSLGRVRFLYIDTPEVYPVEEPFGKEAADFTCDMLKSADKIYIEYDGDRQDQYERVLGWIWVDDLLLQEELTKAGYVDYFYEYNQPKYKDRIQRAYQQAKRNKVGLFR